MRLACIVVASALCLGCHNHSHGANPGDTPVDPLLQLVIDAEENIVDHPNEVSLEDQFPDRGVCAIRGGAGRYLSPLAFRSRAECEGLCNQLLPTHPFQSCEWRGQRLMGDPLGSCSVKGGGAGHVIISLASATEAQCQAECDLASYATYRICDWRTERMRHPLPGAECRILSGARANLVNPWSFGSGASCQALCDQNATDPFRSCLYGNTTLLAPGPDSRCEIWGGSGKVLTPPFFAARADCVSRCASFSANPFRFCWYGTERIQ